MQVPGERVQASQAGQADQVGKAGQAVEAGQATRQASDARTPFGTFLFVVNPFQNDSGKHSHKVNQKTHLKPQFRMSFTARCRQPRWLSVDVVWATLREVADSGIGAGCDDLADAD